MIVYIYVLKHPTTSEVRYVGKTINVGQRLSVHINTARTSNKRRHIINWIKSLLDDNLKPAIEIVDVCNSENWQERETYWIKEFSVKHNLCNHTDGGVGTKITKRLPNSYNEQIIENRKKNLKHKYSDTERVSMWNIIKNSISFPYCKEMLPNIKRNTYYEARKGMIWNEVTGLSKPEKVRCKFLLEYYGNITDKVVKEIKSDYHKGVSQRKLSVKFKLNRTTIKSILSK